MSPTSPAEACVEPPTGGSLATVGGVVTAALVTLGGYAAHDVSAYAVLAVGLVLAWGLPHLLGLPHPAGSGLVLAAAAFGMAGVVVFSGQDDGMRAISVVLAGGLVLAFLHELVRTDGRRHLTFSLSGAALGLVLLAAGMFSAGAASHRHGADVVAATLGAAALVLLIEGIPVVRRWRGRSTAILTVGLSAALVLGVRTGHNGISTAAEVLAVLVTSGVRQSLGRLRSLEPAAHLALGVASVFSVGWVCYGAAWLMNR